MSRPILPLQFSCTILEAQIIFLLSLALRRPRHPRKTRWQKSAERWRRIRWTSVLAHQDRYARMIVFVAAFRKFKRLRFLARRHDMYSFISGTSEGSGCTRPPSTALYTVLFAARRSNEGCSGLKSLPFFVFPPWFPVFFFVLVGDKVEDISLPPYL